MITPLHCRLVFHVVQIVVIIFRRQVTPRMAEMFMCLTFFYADRSEILAFPQFCSLKFLTISAQKMGKRDFQREE